MSENRDYVSRSEEQGNIHIAEDVVATIAAMAAAETEGVGSLSNTATTDLSELLGKKNLTRGVKLTTEEGHIVIDVYLMVKFGFSVTETAQKVQNAVYEAVESMTALAVDQVNSHVGGIVFDKEPKAAKGSE